MGFFTKVFGPSPEEVEILYRLDAIRKTQRDHKRGIESLHRKVNTLMANQQKVTVQVEELKGYLGTIATGVTVLTTTVDNLKSELERVKAESNVDTTELEAAVDGVGEIAEKLQSAINPGEATPEIDPPEDGTPVVEPEVPGIVDEPTTDAPAETDGVSTDTPEPGSTN